MKAHVTTVSFEALLLVLTGLALSNIPLFSGKAGFIDSTRMVVVGILLFCPQVLALVVYAFVPFRRTPNGMDFLHAGGLGVIGLLWTWFATGRLTG